jgi:putative oxidoreductase
MTNIPAPRPQLGLALVRIIVGVTFFMHGWMKLFTFGIPGVTGMLTGMGIPMPGLMAYVLTFAELLCGLALILGLLTRLAAIPLLIDMLVVVLHVKLGGGFFAPKGSELEILLAVGALALVVGGGGAWSLDDIIWHRRTAF